MVKKGCLLTLLLFSLIGKGQVTLKLTLEQVVKLAKDQSPDALTARNIYVNSYWQHRIYQTDFLPRLSLDASSDINRAINPVTQPDGTDVFVERNLATSAGNLSLSQNIGYTGTQLFVNSGVKRIDIISDPNSTSFLSTPVVIGFRQPVLTFNPLRWQRKTEPLRFTEAKRQYLESMENVSVKAVQVFFDMYLAQINLDMAKKNQANNDTLLKIARGRYNLGKIAENELLQIELSNLNSNTALTQTELDYKIKSYNLKKFLGFKDNIDLMLEPPASPGLIKIDPVLALEQAKKNRKKIVEFDRQLIEAEREVAKASSENRFKANLFGTYGLSKSAPELNSSYSNPLDQQQLSLGLEMPIIDWGRAGAQVKMAKAAQELVKTTVEQEKLNFEQEVYLSTVQYQIQDQQFRIAEKADTIGQKRFEAAKQRYYIGKIDVTALNIAVNEKDMARHAYIETLKNYWAMYFNLRRLTLFDFYKNEVIDDPYIRKKL